VNTLNKIIEEDLDFIVSQNVPWDKLENKDILIAGANGFIPSYLVYTLQKLIPSENITLIIRDYNKAREKFGDSVKVIVSDICQDWLQHVPSIYDYIIHAASKANPESFIKNPVDVALSNTIGTYNLLEMSMNCEGFLFLSSGEIYKEIDPLNIKSCYPESKRMGENLCSCYYHQYGVPAKIARLFHIYGPGMDLNDGRLISEFAGSILNKRDIQLESEGLDVRTYTYVADAVVALFKILLEGNPAEAYNVGAPFTEISIHELALLLINKYPELNLKVKKGKIQEKINRIIPDVSKIQKELSWIPQYGLVSGFKRTIESYKI
jgi:nucleoside-diphosphate-sugar epimerase